MAISKAQSGLGTILSIGGPTGATGTETFVTVGEVTDLPFKRPEWKTGDTTHLLSSMEEMTPTILGQSNFTVKLNRVSSDAGQAQVEAAYAGTPPVPYDFKIQLPKNPKANQTTAGDLFTFSAYVLSSDLPNLGPDKIIEGEVKLQLVAAPVFTVGT